MLHSTVHKLKKLKWAEVYMNIDISTVLFTDECRATLDRTDGWSKGWVSISGNRPNRLGRQQERGRVMFWSGTVGGIIVGP